VAAQLLNQRQQPVGGANVLVVLKTWPVGVIDKMLSRR